MTQTPLCSRRHWVRGSVYGLGSLAAACLMKEDGLLASDPPSSPRKPELEPAHYNLLPKKPHFAPKATAMISMFMIGGPSQIDLFDPKPVLSKLDGQEFVGEIKHDNLAQASRQIMGPAWTFRPRGHCGMELSDLVPELGSIADDITLIRSMHSAVNNHLPGMYALNTGAGMGGRPSLGSWLLSGLGSETQDLPAYVAMTHPSGPPLIGGENWSCGGLPSIFQGTMVRPGEPRILNLDPPAFLRGKAQEAQLELLEAVNREHAQQHPGESDLQARMASYALAARMQQAAKEAFDISGETNETMRLYGIDQKETQDYGTRCLVARRLVERGVRFVQIFNNGQSWDHHDSILKALPQRCREIDRPAAALVKDLKRRGMLDTTIVHWGGEMGRLPVIQIPVSGGGREKFGRDHNTYGFSLWMAGGGFKGGYVHGATDAFSHHAVEGVVHHYDWLATVLHLMGLDHHRMRFRVGARDLALIETPDAQVVKAVLT